MAEPVNNYDDEGDDPSPAGMSDEEILKEARERVQYSEDIDSENRKNARSDTEFVWVRGKQWPDGIRQEREAADRPWLEINQLPQFVNAVVNDQRQGRPGIKINAASGDASKEVADILQGMIRHIEVDSNAEAAYDSAFAHAVTGGRGYWRVCSEYERPDSFNQKLCIKRVPDPLSVRMDPDYQDPDAGDAKWCFVAEWLTREEFEKRWPKATALSWEIQQPGGNLTHWYDGNKIAIADYYRIVESPRTLVVMTDGTVGWKDELPPEDSWPEGIGILREREAEDCKCEWYKIAGGEQILETYEWPGKKLPVIMCVGDEIMVDGKRIFQGLIRRARDPQTMYNFWQTAATELIALAPKVPWVGAAGQFENYENEWSQSNRKAIAYLQYNPVSIGGTLAPPPNRTAFADVPAGIVEQANSCKQDLRATIGMYDPSLGRPSNEISGRAILARQRQGDVSTFHFVDNLSRAIALTGRVLLDLIPHYYDTQRIVTTIDDEDQRKMVQINQQMVSPLNLAQVITNPKTDLSVGEYAVTVEAGPSYETKRQETADSMLQFLQNYPPAGPLVGDLIAKNMDFPDADKMAERLKVMLPMPIQMAEAAEAQGQAPPSPREMQAMQQAQQLQQQLQQATQEIQMLKSGVAEKVQVAQITNQQKAQEAAAEDARFEKDAIIRAQRAERDAQIDAQTTLIKAKISADAQIEAARIAEQTKIVISGMQMPPMPDTGMDQPAAPDPQHELSQAMLQLAQTMAHHAAIAAAPRKTVVMMDQDGNPTHSISQPMLQ